MMRAGVCWWAAVFGVAALGHWARAEITVLKTNGTPVPDGTHTKTLNPKTGAWDITLLQLYAPGQETVYEVHGNAGEVIDNLIIDVDGPVAGSPVVVRVIGDLPGDLLTIRNIIQTGTAETLLNRVDVAQDIGDVQVQVIGDLYAGRDIYGTIAATTPDNTVRGITNLHAGRDIRGDVSADNGRILLVWADRFIGSQSDPIEIRAKHHVYHVMGIDVYADINTRFNGGAGGLWALIADRFIGTVNTERLIFNPWNQIDGIIRIQDEFQGVITLGKSFNNPAQFIELPAQGLQGQIIINGDNAPGGTWSAPVMVGLIGDPQQIVLNSPSYAQTPAVLGGGSVGLVPFRLHDTACNPPNGTTVQPDSQGAPLTVQLRHYGPIRWTGSMPPLSIDRRVAGSQAAFTPLPMTQFSATRAADDANLMLVTAAPNQPGFAPGYQYRIRATPQLHCDITGVVPAAWTVDYFVTVAIPPCDGDIDSNGAVNVSDLLLVIGYWGQSAPAFPAADANGDGIVNVSDLLMVIGHWGPC